MCSMRSIMSASDICIAHAAKYLEYSNVKSSLPHFPSFPFEPSPYSTPKPDTHMNTRQTPCNTICLKIGTPKPQIARPRRQAHRPFCRAKIPFCYCSCYCGPETQKCQHSCATQRSEPPSQVSRMHATTPRRYFR
jgi:hypothetical protein